MDPATLYILVLLADGTEHLSRAHIETMGGCEQVRTMLAERKPADHEILNSVCWPLGAEPPVWTNQSIHGVPLIPPGDPFR